MAFQLKVNGQAHAVDAADDDAVPDDHRADRRVGPAAPLPAPAEDKRQRHETAVGSF